MVACSEIAMSGHHRPAPLTGAPPDDRDGDEADPDDDLGVAEPRADPADRVPEVGAVAVERIGDPVLGLVHPLERPGEEQADAGEHPEEDYAGCDGPGEEVAAVLPMNPSHEENVMPTPST